MEERLGHLEAVRWCPDERRPRGNLRLLESHPLTSRVKEAYAKGLPYFGLSHVIDGKGYEKGGITYVEEVTKVMSVDLVDNAATGTLVEQEEAPAGDAFGMAIQALLAEAGITKEVFLEKAEALWDSLKGDGEAAPAAAAADAPAMEQTLALQVKALQEQVAALTKPKPSARFIKPKAAPLHVSEQTQSTVPTERKALGAWLRSKD